MKNILSSLFLAAICLIPNLSFANDDNGLVVKNVTVYLQGAQIEAEYTVLLKKGYNKIVIENLPNDFVDESLQIKPMSTLARLVNVSTQYNALKNTLPNKSQVELKLEEINYNLDLLKAKKEVTEGEEKVILNNSKIGNEEQGWSVEQLQKLSAFYATRMNEIAKQKLTLQKEIKILELERNDLMKQLNQVDNSNRKEIILGLESKSVVTVTLSVKYLVRNAGWSPKYEIRATGVDQPINLTYRASIYQNTGQNWDNVNVNISTYQPNSNQNSPILYPQYAEIQTIQPVAYRMMSNSNESKVYANKRIMTESADNVEEEIAFAPLAEKESQQFNVIYKVSGNHTFLSGGEPVILVVNEEKLNADYIYQTTPKLDQRVFLIAKVKDWQNLEMVNGEALIYYDDQYVGKMQIDTRNTNDAFNFSLGVDNRIVVERNKVDKYFSKKFLKSTVEEQYGYQIVLRNNSTKNIKIQVLDQIPLSQDSRIKIEPIELSAAAYDETKGSLTWTFDLSEKQKTLDFAYTVKYPKDENVRYFNR